MAALQKIRKKRSARTDGDLQKDPFMSAVPPLKRYQILIFHVDVNSAFLSWSALKALEENPGSVDLRTIPSAVAGDVETRHGIITAKSIPAKQFGIETAEPVGSALRKCPSLVLVKSDFRTYRMYSRELMDLLREYSPKVQQVSIDEAYLDMSHLWAEDRDGDLSLPLETAGRLREEVLRTLGFTVNVGISVNKLLAKTASDFTKPDQTHTLWPEEVPEKLWPMPVGQLHGCGHATAERLNRIGIFTVGEAARADPVFLRSVLGEKSSEYILRSANGLGSTRVSAERGDAKSCSNETTTAEDIGPENYEALALPILRRLSDKVAERLKRDGIYGQSVTVSVKTDRFRRRSRQVTLPNSTNDADRIYENAAALARGLLFGSGGPFSRGEKIRLIGVGMSRLDRGEYRQMTLFDMETGHAGSSVEKAELPERHEKPEKAERPEGHRKPKKAEKTGKTPPADAARRKKLDEMMSGIRKKYGEDAIRKGS